MLKEMMEQPRKLSKYEAKQAGYEMVENLVKSHPGVNYEQVYDILASYKQVADEAIKVLNWNAGMENKDRPVNFLLVM